MHGARKKESIKRGDLHPNYTHGNRTLESQKQASEQSLELQQLEDAMHLLGLTTAKRSQGRKANGYCKIMSSPVVKKNLQRME